MYVEDTIAAIATPFGSGGIGIVRISGSAAESIGLKLFRFAKGGGFKSHRLLYGHLIDPGSGSVIDEAMAVLMRAPNSYTREDVLELHVHGGFYVVRRALQACLSLGARHATPGEFTKRAFLNGRIDLAQAESVVDVINSLGDSSLDLALRQAGGSVSQVVSDFRRNLIDVLALVEAHIDFPDEDISPDSVDLISARVSHILSGVNDLIDSFRFGRVLREGAAVLLVGKPNAGKSSLLNALTCEDRAIVSSVPGTTRDLIEEVVNIDGLPVRIIDAAGIRQHSPDLVEQEGIKRTVDKLSTADLVLFLIDGSSPVDLDDFKILSLVESKSYLVVLTKSDLGLSAATSGFLPEAAPVFNVSSKSLSGVAELRKSIFNFFVGSNAPPSSSSRVVVSSARHYNALVIVRDRLSSFVMGAKSFLSPELLAVDLRDALYALGEITGETTPDDVLDVIFSSFCIGK